MYQYFENKKELFLYIIDLVIQIKIEYMSNLFKEKHNLSYFELIKRMLYYSFNYYTKYPDLYQIYQTFHNEMHKDINIEINEKINELGYRYNKELLLIALENKEIREDLSKDVVSFMVYDLIKKFGAFLIDQESVVSDKEWDEYVYQFIELLKNGLKTNTD